MTTGGIWHVLIAIVINPQNGMHMGYTSYKIQDSIINTTIHKPADASKQNHASDKEQNSTPFR